MRRPTRNPVPSLLNPDSRKSLSAQSRRAVLQQNQAALAYHHPIRQTRGQLPRLDKTGSHPQLAARVGVHALGAAARENFRRVGLDGDAVAAVVGAPKKRSATSPIRPEAVSRFNCGSGNQGAAVVGRGVEVVIAQYSSRLPTHSVPIPWVERTFSA
jgi:hypothetical protein